MNFVHTRQDDLLRQALLGNQVISDRDLNAMIDGTKLESGHLFEDVLLPNAAKIDSSKWNFWLLRLMGLNRLNKPAVTKEFIRGAGFTPKQCSNFIRWQVYPIGYANGKKQFIVVVGRPEYLPEAKEMIGNVAVCLSAAPSEILAIYREYKSRASP